MDPQYQYFNYYQNYYNYYQNYYNQYYANMAAYTSHFQQQPNNTNTTEQHDEINEDRGDEDEGTWVLTDEAIALFAAGEERRRLRKFAVKVIRAI